VTVADRGAVREVLLLGNRGAFAHLVDAHQRRLFRFDDLHRLAGARRQSACRRRDCANRRHPRDPGRRVLYVGAIA
jgi:hypothetical protein